MNKKHRTKSHILDDEEREILKSFENGEWESIKHLDLEEEKTHLKKSAVFYIKQFFNNINKD